MILRYTLEDNENETGRVIGFGDSEEFPFELSDTDPLTFQNFVYYRKGNGEWIYMTEEELSAYIESVQ
jgi:hypothetical protein